MSCEVLVKTQNGRSYKEFRFPLDVMSKEEVIKNFADDYIVNGYGLFMGYDLIGDFEEEKHAIHIMNYLLTRRLQYINDDDGAKTVILSVPTDEIVKQTPEENLINNVPTKNDGKNVEKTTNNEGNYNE